MTKPLNSQIAAAALHQSAAAMGLDLADDQVQPLLDGQSVSVSRATASCCGDGWFAIGRRPTWCVKPGWPPEVKICWD
jgi:hypothetical protein